MSENADSEKVKAAILPPASHGFFAAIPVAARWLGLGGAIPFLGLSVSTAFTAFETQAVICFVLVAYGAVILSFLGGIRWGQAISDPKRSAQDGKALWTGLGISVVPALIGWGAVLVSAAFALPLLVASFVLMLLSDLHAVRAGDFPKWFGNLRVILTCLVVASLLFAWLTYAV
ncbi:DUF3429 domain-containing protein [Thalassospira sp. MA62]|nr:DUF3429 domain-containing protein [Thalassospira sp. MA62]